MQTGWRYDHERSDADQNLAAETRVIGDDATPFLVYLVVDTAVVGV
jgi:hypothetical protein